MKRLWILVIALIALAVPARAEMDGDSVYTLYDAQGNELTMRAGRMYVGDEYISGDDHLYRVASVDDAARTARAEYIGPATLDGASATAFASLIAAAEPEKKIAMYSTHSDESYVPSDGESSKLEDAGIYDVGEALAKSFEERGIEVVYSRETFHPHDAGAYRRSRRTAEELLKDSPDALLDIHRDAIPAEQYETEVEGEDVSKVRLFVGRSNPNGDENRAFAQQIKAVADKMYPGLIKDIYMGKGAYNQDLAPRSVLLEFGTHTLPKERVLASTGPMSEVVYKALYGGVTGSAGASDASRAPASETVEGADQDNNGAGWAVWLVVALVAGLGLFAFLSTGGRGGMSKFGRSLSEMTGGLFGKKPPRE